MSGGARFGKYVLVKRLGHAGRSEVFLARLAAERTAGPLLALKRLLPVGEDLEQAQMFLEEARVVSQLRHPGLVQIHEVGRVEGLLYIAMEYVHGVTLEALADSLRGAGARFPWEAAVRIGVLLCEVLEYAHGALDLRGRPLHLVHRDVNPSNVMVAFGGWMKLLDFGVARTAGRQVETQPGIVKAKLLYAAPEQYRFEPVTPATDLYGVALTLFVLLAGVHPFEQGGTRESLQAILEAPPPSLERFRKDLPRNLSRTLTRALAKAPKERQPSLRALRHELEATLSKSPFGTPELADWMESRYPRTSQLPVERPAAPSAETEPTLSPLKTDLPSTRRLKGKTPTG